MPGPCAGDTGGGGREKVEKGVVDCDLGGGGIENVCCDSCKGCCVGLNDHGEAEAVAGCTVVGCMGAKELRPLVAAFGLTLLCTPVDDIGLNVAKALLRLWSGVMVRDWGLGTPDIELWLFGFGGRAGDDHEKAGGSGFADWI